MFVYITTCLVNGKKYIGKYEGKETDKYLGSGKLIKRAIKKYGVGNFTREIVERFSTKEGCREGEKKWITYYDATNSSMFYNIALGGEGGNTFAGLKGKEREKLLEKLKGRRKGIKKKNVVSCWDVKSKTRKVVPKAEFLTNIFLFGNSCKGIYKTPKGYFSSSKIASTYHYNMCYNSLSKRCLNPNRKITKSHLICDKELTSLDINKTFGEIGYSFIPITEITEDFLTKVEIIKQNKYDKANNN